MHEKVIVHIDIDCFYAQVEEILDPTLRGKPMGVQQKTCLVTCNYEARQFGIKKLMNVRDSLKLCPDLVLVNGEDLTKYKKMSEQIFSVIQKFVTSVEKLGLDENYIDVTEIVDTRMNEEIDGIEKETFTLGLGDDDECDCGCKKRLSIGTFIAREIRQALFDELGITSCAGIAHNKLLAKLVGARNKPNKQTVIFPGEIENFLKTLGNVRALCGIGSKTEGMLEELGVRTVNDLQNVETNVLKRKFDERTSERLKELALGIDKSEVKTTTKQKTISIEDSTYSNPLKTLLEVETKLNVLLIRLVDAAVIDQKRIPTSLKLIVRKTANVKELLQRETKQKDVPASFFKSHDSVTIVSFLFPVAMQLFKQIMSTETQFKITLLGTAFTKFIDQESSPKETNALLKYLKPVNEPQTTKRKDDESEDEPAPKKLKKLQNNFEIPQDMDTKAFNCLPISEKKRIMNELREASSDSSVVDYPRKVENKVKRNKMDAFVFKY